MAGEDDDDVIIAAVFIGQDGKIWIFVLDLDRLSDIYFPLDGLKIQSFYQYYDGYWSQLSIYKLID